MEIFDYFIVVMIILLLIARLQHNMKEWMKDEESRKSKYLFLNFIGLFGIIFFYTIHIIYSVSFQQASSLIHFSTIIGLTISSILYFYASYFMNSKK